MSFDTMEDTGETELPRSMSGATVHSRWPPASATYRLPADGRGNHAIRDALS